MADPGSDRMKAEEVLERLMAGNRRYAASKQRHTNQTPERRQELSEAQEPIAVILGCADSRVPPEVIFDRGLGDLFVVRTAGHVVDPSVLGSLEFRVGVLGCPLIVVLGHDSCGAVRAGITSVETGELPPGFLRDIVERVTPSVLAATRHGRTSVEEIQREHVAETARLLASRSTLIHDRVADGRLAIVGAEYALADGRVRVVESVGDVETGPTPR